MDALGILTHASKQQKGVTWKFLKWAVEQGCEWGLHSYSHAAGAKIEVLEWARNNGCPWGYGKLWYAAAEGGHLEILKWATENREGGYLRRDWPSFICGMAAKKGHLNVFIWGIEQGGEWKNKEKVVAEASVGGHTNICDWINVNG